jgi:hypothetical protein
VLERFGHCHRGFQPHKLGRHDPAGGVIGILQQMIQLCAHLSTEFRQHPMPLVQIHLLNDVSAFVSG